MTTKMTRTNNALSGVLNQGLDTVRGQIEQHNAYLNELKERFKVTRTDLDEIIQNNFLRFTRPDVPLDIEDIPDDLNDEHLHLIHDAQGRRMSGSLLLSDFLGTGSATVSPVFPVLRAQLFPYYLFMIPVIYVLCAIPSVGTLLSFALVWLAPKLIAAKQGISVNWFAPTLWTRLNHDNATASDGEYAERRLSKMERVSEGSGFLSFKVLARVFGLAIGLMIMSLMIATPVLCAVVLPIYILVKIRGDAVRGMEFVDESERELALQRQDQHFTRSSASTDMALMDQSTVQAKRDQVEQAIKDDSPLLDIGLIASGLMARDGDIDAPDAGKSMVFSLNDLFPGLLMFGEPGTGKTAGVFRPLADELFFKTDCGALVCDTKGTLQMEFKARYGDDFKLVSPVEGGENIAPIQGLSAYQAAQFITEAMSGGAAQGQSGGDIWSDAAQRDMTMRAIILEEAKRLGVYGVKWTVNSLIKLMGDNAETTRLAGEITTVLNSQGTDGVNPYLMTAFDYVMREFPNMGNDTRSSITFTAQSWATKITMHPELFRWMDCEEGVVVEDVCKGLRIGVYVPVTQYGAAGMVVEKILRYRVYNAIMNRPDNWRELGQKPVALLWDEMAAGIGQGIREADMMPMCRSRGLGIVAATQTLTELEGRMNEERAHALVALFPNVIAYRSDANTMTHLSANLGVIRKLSRITEAADVPVGIDYYGAVEAIHQSRTGASTVYDGDFIAKVREIQEKNWRDDVAEKNAIGYLPLPNELDFPEGEKLCIKVLPRWEPDRYGYLLNNNMYAVARIKRAGRYRYDVAYTTPIFTSAMFNPILDESIRKDYEMAPLVKKPALA